MRYTGLMCIGVSREKCGEGQRGGGQVTTGLGLWELCLKIFEIIGIMLEIIVLNSVEKLSIILLFDSFK